MAKYNMSENELDNKNSEKKSSNWSFGKDTFEERCYLIEKMFMERLHDYVVEPWVTLDKLIIERDYEAENFEIMSVILNFRFGSERSKDTQQSIEFIIPGIEFSNYDFISGMIYQQLENTNFGGFYSE